MRILIVSPSLRYKPILGGLSDYLNRLGHDARVRDCYEKGFDLILGMGKVPLINGDLNRGTEKKILCSMGEPIDGTEVSINCCPNPRIHIRKPTNKKYDVSVLSIPSDESRELAVSLEERGFSVFCPDMYVEDPVKIINESRIILNLDSAYDPVIFCTCLGSGGFLLSLPVKCPECLKDGRDFISCQRERIIENITYYINHPDEASRVGDSGYRTVWKNFKWENEWPKIEKASGPSGFMKGRNYFFIIGSQRSGTTLMELLLDSHPDIAVFGEPGVYEKLLNEDPTPCDKILGFKIPMWIHKSDEIRNKYPGARIIFMKRDLRAIVSSMIRLGPWTKTEMNREMENALSGIGEDYIRSTLKTMYDHSGDVIEKAVMCAYTKQSYAYTYQSILPCIIVDYEKLVDNPEPEMKRVLEFLGVPWNGDVLRHHELHKGIYAGSTNSQRPIDRSRIEAWRSTLTTEQAGAVMGMSINLDRLFGLPLSGYKHSCSICGHEEFDTYEKCNAYVICRNCGLYQQWPMPARIYEGKEENFGKGPGTGHLMPDSDKEANRNLANALYSSLKPGSVLDIGTKYPYFLSVLKERCRVLGIDAIEGLEEYGQQLGVSVIRMDIETADVSKLEKHDLITLIHVLEHFHSPLETIKKINQLLSDNGVIFIRTPDPEVIGIERDLTSHHLTIHPHLFTEKSIKKLFSDVGLEIYRHDFISGYGQSDYYARKKIQQPKISFCMIVKNEAENIVDCLESIKDHVDEIVIVDTGSTDNTIETVKKYTDKIHSFKWNDNFSDARNYSLSKATGNFILWGDADDVFENPNRIREEIKEGFDVYNANILYGNDIFCHARLFRNGIGVHFSGWVHEFPVIGSNKFKIHTSLNVRHKTEKHSTENRTLRNYRILRKWLKTEPDNSRALFYMGCTVRDLGQDRKAIETFQKYLSVASWRDEMFMAQKYIGQIYQRKGEYQKAISEYLKAISIDDRWAEAYYYAGECYFHLKDYKKCIGWMVMAAGSTNNDSTLFKEVRIYQDLPYRYLFACYEILGDWHRALKYSEKALEKNPSDEWLKGRRDYFLQKVDDKCREPDSTAAFYKPRIIECYRQGSLGDCLMTTAALRGLKKKYPECHIRYVTNQKSMDILSGNKYIDELVTTPGDAADEKVYFCYPDKNSVLKNEGYPDKPLSRHIVQIFNECAGVPDAGMELECTLSDTEEIYGRRLKDIHGNYVSLHIKAGWSAYKEWPTDRWKEVVSYLISKKLPVLLIGSENDPVVDDRCVDYRGLPIKESISLIKYACFHIGIDSFSNHAAHAVNTRSIILFGSTSPIGSGYPDCATNIWKSIECSPCYREYQWSPGYRGECPYQSRCMSSISVQDVILAIEKFFP